MSKSVTDESRFDELYANLNPAQRQAVDIIEGPVVVNAGPGTGKTQILTLRIANILRLQGADMAPNILALTFTNAGVRAMRDRLAGIIGSAAYEVNIFTFHSFAEYIINTYREYFGDLLVAQPLADTERFALVERIIRESDLSTLRPFGAPHLYVGPVIRAIDELKRDNYTPESFVEWNEQFKEELLTSEDSYYKRATKNYNKGDLRPDALKKYEKNIELGVIYAAYQDALKKEQRYDFNDMILKLLEAIDINEDFAYQLQEQYQYILVDEHQDTNEAQNAIVSRLVDAAHLDGRPNLFTVGDDKQAIYRFQGASLENFLAFQDSFQDVVVINLDQNYRSGQPVLDAAHSLISADDGEREHQALWAQHEESAIACHEFISYTDELHWIAQDIKQKVQTGVPLRDMAILYRENRNVDQIQKVLSQHQITSVILAKENVLETPIVAKILLLLQVVHDISDNAKLASLLYTDVFDTSAYEVVKIIERFRRGKRNTHTGTKHLYHVLQDKKTLQEIGVSNPDVYISIAEILNLAITTFASNNFLQSFDQLVEQTTLLPHILADADSYNQLRYYDRLYSYLRSLQDGDPRLSLETVLAQFDTLAEYNIALDSEGGDYQDGVRLLTAHKAKGLEFPHVYIINVVDKTWGNKTTREMFRLPVGSTSGSDDDERRLLYVGITRAQKHCSLSFSRMVNERDQSPSRFLYEIDESVIQWEQHTQPTPLQDIYQPIDACYSSASVLDDDMIREIYRRRSLSVTALNNFYTCPARYFVNNLLQIPASYSRTLLYGSLIHKALEEFFTASRDAGAVLPKDDLVTRFEQALEAEYLDETDRKDMHSRGVESLSGYWEANHDQWSHLITTELRINGVVVALPNGGEITLTGALDKLEHNVDDEQRVRVIDYKTGKVYSKKSKDEQAALDRQIVFYSLLLQHYRKGYYSMESGMLDFIEPHSDSGNYEQHRLQPSSDDVADLLSKIQEMDTAIQSGSDFLHKRCGKQECEACSLMQKLEI
jgi:DNA helicase-2/ATP-dependent DNA helicase PcrA